MVDFEKSKCYRLFSLPYRSLALNLVITDENAVIGYDNCGYSYIGKLGADFKVSLVSFNTNEKPTCLIGTIDFDKKRILGEWLSDENLEKVILDIVITSSVSLFECLPTGDINLLDTQDKLLNDETTSEVKKYLITKMGKKS